jgi:hypothetical protein
VGFLVFATSEVAAVEKSTERLKNMFLGFVGRHATVSTGMASHPIGLAGGGGAEIEWRVKSCLLIESGFFLL